MQYRADSRLAPSQWEMLLQSKAISHWLGTNIEPALQYNDKWQSMNRSTSEQHEDKWLIHWKWFHGQKLENTCQFENYIHNK